MKESHYSPDRPTMDVSGQNCRDEQDSGLSAFETRSRVSRYNDGELDETPRYVLHSRWFDPVTGRRDYGAKPTTDRNINLPIGRLWCLSIFLGQRPEGLPDADQQRCTRMPDARRLGSNCA